MRQRLRRGITGIHASHSRSSPSTTSNPTSDPPRCRAAGRTNSGSKNGFGSTARDARSPQAATSCGLNSRSGINRPAGRRDLRPTSVRTLGTETDNPAKVNLSRSTMQQHAKHRAHSPHGTARTLSWRSIHGVSRWAARITRRDSSPATSLTIPFASGAAGTRRARSTGSRNSDTRRRTFALLRLADDSCQRERGRPGRVAGAIASRESHRLDPVVGRPLLAFDRPTASACVDSDEEGEERRGGDGFCVARIARLVSVCVWREGAAGADGMVLEQPFRCQVRERRRSCGCSRHRMRAWTPCYSSMRQRSMFAA